jgi:hypothetical protein
MEGQCGIEFGVLNHSLAVELVRVRLEKWGTNEGW